MLNVISVLKKCSSSSSPRGLLILFALYGKAYYQKSVTLKTSLSRPARAYYNKILKGRLYTFVGRNQGLANRKVDEKNIYTSK